MQPLRTQPQHTLRVCKDALIPLPSFSCRQYPYIVTFLQGMFFAFSADRISYASHLDALVHVMLRRPILWHPRGGLPLPLGLGDEFHVRVSPWLCANWSAMYHKQESARI